MSLEISNNWLTELKRGQLGNARSCFPMAGKVRETDLYWPNQHYGIFQKKALASSIFGIFR